MKPHVEEAWRALRMANRDALAFNILAASQGVHLEIILSEVSGWVAEAIKWAGNQVRAAEDRAENGTNHN